MWELKIYQFFIRIFFLRILIRSLWLLRITLHDLRDNILKHNPIPSSIPPTAHLQVFWKKIESRIAFWKTKLSVNGTHLPEFPG